MMNYINLHVDNGVNSGWEGANGGMNGYPEVSVEDSGPAANPRLSEGPEETGRLISELRGI